MLNIKRWFKISLINFVVVAAIGVLMRYKIGFPFPFFDQKNLQHGHSHFAFTGWISQSIMLFMVASLQHLFALNRLRIYRWLLGSNLLISYAMLLSFIYSGYNPLSIIFSSISLVIGILFALLFAYDIFKMKHFESRKWYYMAFTMYGFSSIGTIALSYMMATKQITQTNYLTSVYWYLHFQYNGWFFFACAGLMVHYFIRNLNLPKLPISVFRFFAMSCVPAFGLSILWMNLPNWAVTLIGIAAASQLYAWFSFIKYCINNKVIQKIKAQSTAKILFHFVALAITVKLCLQMASVIPSVSILTFGFRSIVIAYLHLVFLGIISLLLITFALQNEYISINKQTSTSLLMLLCSIVLYELVLCIQGVSSFGYHVIPNIDFVLVFLSACIFASLVSILIAQFTYKRSINI